MFYPYRQISRLSIRGYIAVHLWSVGVDLLMLSFLSNNENENHKCGRRRAILIRVIGDAAARQERKYNPQIAEPSYTSSPL